MGVSTTKSIEKSRRQDKKRSETKDKPPWLDDSIPARLCRLADKVTMRPRAVVMDARLLKSAKLRKADMTDAVIAAAESLERQWQDAIWDRVEALNPKREDEAAVQHAKPLTSPPGPSNPPKSKSTRSKIFGYSINVISKWMGKNGFSRQEAIDAVKTLAKSQGESGSVNESTIGAGVSHGKSGNPKRIGKLPILTNQQIEELYKSAGKKKKS